MIRFNYDDSTSGEPFKSSLNVNQRDTSLRRKEFPNAEAERINTQTNAQSKHTTCMKHKSETCENRIKQLTVFQARQINGCLIRAPTTFYTDIW